MVNTLNLSLTVIRKNGGISYNLCSGRCHDCAKLKYCVASDPGDKIEPEEKTFQNEQRFKALVQEGLDLIAITDAAANYLYTSPAGSAITRIPPEEFIGRNAFEFIYPDDVARALACLEKLATEKRVKPELFQSKNLKKHEDGIISINIY